MPPVWTQVHWEACETRRQETGIKAQTPPRFTVKATPWRSRHLPTALKAQNTIPDLKNSWFNCSFVSQMPAFLQWFAPTTHTVSLGVYKMSRVRALFLNKSLFIIEKWANNYHQPACGGYHKDTKCCGCSEERPVSSITYTTELMGREENEKINQKINGQQAHEKTFNVANY